MVTADQLVVHAIGDYVVQSHWMATEKTKRSLAAAIHAVTYGVGFLLLRASWSALAVIVGTHFVIDRWRLARFVVFTKNFLLSVAPLDMLFLEPEEQESAGDWRTTGSPAAAPPFLAVWLLIIVDNVMHVLINAAALRWL